MSEREPSRDGADVPAAVAGIAMAALDARGVLTAWTAGAGRLLGYRPYEVLGRAAADLLAVDFPASALPGIGRGEECNGRVVLRHRDGRAVEVDIHAASTHGVRGNTGWVVVALEPGEPGSRHDTAAALKNWALDQMPIVLGIYDREKRLVGGNEEAQRVIAAREEAVLGLRPGEIYPSLTADQVEQLMAQVIRTGERLTLETVTPLPGESRAHAWSIFLYPLKDPGGMVRGVSTAALDTTTQYRARQRLAIVNAASVRIGTTLDTARTAQELADVAAEQFADFVSVDLLDSAVGDNEADLRRAAAGGVLLCRAAQQSVLDGCPESTVEPGKTDRCCEDSPMARALVTGRPSRHAIDTPDIQAWLEHDTARARSVRVHGIHSLVVVPLLARGTTLGLAVFLRHRTPDPFDTDDLLLAEEITARAALCIDNARRYTHEHNTVLALQRSMLPQRTSPHVAVAVASRHPPAGSGAGVGGDWFDVVPLSGARVALVVGDVVGHGIQALATMGRLRLAVRTLADMDMPPDELLTHLDDLVLRLADREEDPGAEEMEGAAGEIGASCLYAVYDPISRRCTLARAGHPVSSVVAPDGTVDFPELPAGPPLGLGGLPFESVELELPDGSLIALFTNGPIESGDHGTGAGADADTDVGFARLSRVLTSSSSTSSLEQICDNVLEALLPGGVPTDDVAVLLARTQGMDASQVAVWDLPADPAVVAQARQMATDQLAAWGLEEASFVTELVVSELVTNAIRHAVAPIQLRLIHESSLICEVSDASSTAPHLRRARVFDEGGRGLLLVAQLTQRWGTRHTPHGKIIWAEQPLPTSC
ncbi:SpoIIE family protein phosphatase [Candidatus Protofrankia californiensis]|uniref:SpoIIE family protein phosphatase n=1 Tax=Candidatus Protofrankia californiensis TaxID=1839754 RepID=UPI0019CFE726|nr:SpoIIE family protein phosphatase [Candidatus Protofrankia californiensis]